MKKNLTPEESVAHEFELWDYCEVNRFMYNRLDWTGWPVYLWYNPFDYIDQYCLPIHPHCEVPGWWNRRSHTDTQEQGE